MKQVWYVRIETENHSTAPLTVGDFIAGLGDTVVSGDPHAPIFDLVKVNDVHEDKDERR